ncbi:IS66 family transposase [Paenibacillus sp. YN15]|uniref:IS66 family transposase n=1 Tax=Paenibacillus sp. YN15 TaxID=1742774 RepID=UPI000DCE2817|nr:IS66 family transposase [Paenibacillus sp. YN15]RAU90772.1 IS66 family transposase [Paenibacillus sp. YN15]
MDFSPQQVNQISKGDPEIAGFIQTLLDQNRALTEQNRRLQEVVDTQAKQIQTLEKRVHELERQLRQQSHNSSKPPSSDGLRKPPNLRTPGGSKGAPKGHPGTTLHVIDHPDEVVVCELITCPDCLSSLVDAPCVGEERRQEFDLPASRIWTTEFRAQKRYCACCQQVQRAPFPAHITAPTQYGSRMAAWTVYLHAFHLLPLQRIAQLFEDWTTYRPSEGTLLSFLQTSYERFAPVEVHIEAQLHKQVKVHADETGCRVGGRTQWMHVMSDETYTLLRLHARRGSPAMDAIGFLPSYTGTVVHDCMKGYFNDKYGFSHALCNAHLLRECIGIAEHDGHEWAKQMIDLLKEGWTRALRSRQADIPLEPQVIESFLNRYDTILQAGEGEWTKDTVRAKTCKKGRAIKSKAGNLGERFLLHKEAVLSFLWRPCIPFDNNQAERDLRMVKVKQKISGSFRTEDGALWFARLRSVVSTFIKQRLPVLSSLSLAFSGTPVLL